MRRSTKSFLVMAAAVWAIAVAVAAAKRSSEVVTPEPMYEHLQELMSRGMSPSYKAAWSAYERDDRQALRSALLNISELAGRLDKYTPPRNAAYLRHYVQHMEEVRRASAALSAGVDRADRGAVSAGVLRIYQSCQSCHEDYAPEGNREARLEKPAA